MGPKGTVKGLKVVYLDNFDLPSLVTPALLEKVAKRTEVRTAWLRLGDRVDRADVLDQVSGAAVLAGQVPVGGPALLDLKLLPRHRRDHRGQHRLPVGGAARRRDRGGAGDHRLGGRTLARARRTAGARPGETPAAPAVAGTTQAVALAAAVVGIGLGLLVGLTGSTLLTRALHIPAAMNIPVLPILVLSILVVLVVRAAVLLPLERAAHVSPASALSQGGN